MSERYRTATVTDVFGYTQAWRRPDEARRAEVGDLIGVGAPKRVPGPEGGPVLGDGSDPDAVAAADLPDPGGGGGQSRGGRLSAQPYAGD